jgi:hypothetical protein
VCNHEGNDIIKSVDLDNLGELQGRENSSSLNVEWGPNPKIEIPKPPEQASDTTSDGTEKVAGQDLKEGPKSKNSAEEVSPAPNFSQSASVNILILLGLHVTFPHWLD